MKSKRYLVVMLFGAAALAGAEGGLAWEIDSQEQWWANIEHHENLSVEEGMVSPTAPNAVFRTKLKTFSAPRSAASIVFEQSPVWQNWRPIDNIEPINLFDAPVFLSLGPDNYWIFGRYRTLLKGEERPLPPFTPQPATLEGFEDTKLQTTRFANQYDAPGGLKKRQNGFHAWQSKDMVNWVHHGPVTDRRAAWVTTAEYVDGKAYIYYDFPNDQDPHLYVDDNLFDGKLGTDMGLAFKDPSHGSDCAFIRSPDGKFHVIYEDWSPVHPNSHAFDSPLAGHAVSEDGKGDFKILAPAIDVRTTPTGKIGTFKHPHWTKEDPENFPSNIGEYEIHKPDQEAFGDWAAIAIGGRYYLFGDYHKPPKGTPMSVAWFTSDSLDQEFVFCDKIGQGHPDPDVCFAEGQFYLVTQQKTDYVSPGPWVESVEVRVGVDTDGDGQIDRWTDWQAVKETYDHIPGFAKQVAKAPAAIDLADLPEGTGFQFEVKLTDTTENKSKPILDRVRLEF